MKFALMFLPLVVFSILERTVSLVEATGLAALVAVALLGTDAIRRRFQVMRLSQVVQFGGMFLVAVALPNFDLDGLSGPFGLLIPGLFAWGSIPLAHPFSGSYAKE